MWPTRRVLVLRFRSVVPAVACLTLMWASPVQSQVILHRFDGGSAREFLGASVGPAGDRDGDGFGDVAVGSPGEHNGNGTSGSVRILSGLDGSLIRRFTGSTNGGGFGRSLSNLGDVNNDGHPEFLITEPTAFRSGATWGRAWVFSGVDGAVLYSHETPTPSNDYGFTNSQRSEEHK